ncbi:hypothetical protein TNCV_102931 [Trichonephila clavipes]|nr:hypothetical protein TNCV_102931 [Trichonephila clavipes]
MTIKLQRRSVKVWKENAIFDIGPKFRIPLPITLEVLQNVSLMTGLLFSRRNVPRSLITPHPVSILGHQDTLAFEEENASRTFAFRRPHLICIPGTAPAARPMSRLSH